MDCIHTTADCTATHRGGAVCRYCDRAPARGARSRSHDLNPRLWRGTATRAAAGRASDRVYKENLRAALHMSLPLTMPFATHWVGFGVADQIKLGAAMNPSDASSLLAKS